MDRFLNSFRLTGAYPRVLVWVSCCSSFTIPQCTSKVYRASPSCKVNWELKQWRQRRQRGRQKSNRFYYAKQQLCTCITLFCTFLYRPCTTTTWKCNSKFYGGRKQATTNLFFSLNLSAVLKKSTPGKFAYTCHFKQIGINATKIEKTGIHFKTDVFAAVAFVDAKAP